MKKLTVFTLLTLIAVSLVGCASILSKSNYPVAISSSPDQATFTITDRNGIKVHTGKTPSTVTLKSGCGFFKKSEYTIKFSKDGFEDKTTTVTSTMDGWYIGNILFGGFIGILIVDPATGAMWKIPDMVSTSLNAEISTQSNISKSSHLKLVMMSDVPEKFHGELIRIQ